MKPPNPLARTEIGDQKVQGMDFAYTLQGWIKGINSETLEASKDIGKDADAATVGNINKFIAQDAMAYTLNYFDGDYKPIAASKNTVATQFNPSSNLLAGLNTSKDAPNLYNGNISSMLTTINDLTDVNNPVVKPQLTAYQYDQLNRIKQMKAYSMNVNASNVFISTNDSYKTNVDYDANGNITHMTRNGVLPGTNLEMDDLTYKYENIANGYTRNTNKLRHVNDKTTYTNNYQTDIDDQGTFGTGSENYTYDEIGNLKKDAQEEIETIAWTVYGKVKSVTRKAGSTKSDLEFHYDASGNRISKIVKPHATASTPSTWTTTYYVRDASGNVMSTYEVKPNDTKFYLAEQYLYGSSRLGLQSRDLDMSTTVGNFASRTLGKKNYEMTNHLGNVLTTVSDRKIPVDNLGNGTGTTIAYFKADITSVNDYGVWGDLLPQRHFSSSSYKFGFNGKEKVEEWDNKTGVYDFDARMLNVLLGRWMSPDPLAIKYPNLAPYNFSFNNPIIYIDPNGEYPNIRITKDEQGNTTITLTSYAYISKNASPELKQVLSEAAKEFTGIQLNECTKIVFDVKIVEYENIKLAKQEKVKTGGVFVEEKKNINGASYLDEVITVSMQYANREGETKNITSKDALHEWLHDFGFADQYITTIIKKVGTYDLVLKEYLGTIMGDIGGCISNIEYTKIYEGLKQEIANTSSNAPKELPSTPPVDEETDRPQAGKTYTTVGKEGAVKDKEYDVKVKKSSTNGTAEGKVVSQPQIK